jgi:GT2 family glycosyltransferase
MLIEKEPNVALLVINYNSKHSLRGRFESLKNQTYSNFSVFRSNKNKDSYLSKEKHKELEKRSDCALIEYFCDELCLFTSGVLLFLNKILLFSVKILDH